MGTGLGRDGYSVIGQGKVSEIVESGGSKRREVFEEAAGVSKFLAQKKDAENKLKRTEDNLLRIRDIASELETRLPVLEKQAAKAKKAKELLSREEDLDITVSMYELSALEKTISEAEDKLLLSKAECENLDRDIMDRYMLKDVLYSQIIIYVIDYMNPKYMHMEVGEFIEEWQPSQEQSVRNILYKEDKMEILAEFVKQIKNTRTSELLLQYYFIYFIILKYIFCVFFTINTQKKRKGNRSYCFLSVFYYNFFF